MISRTVALFFSMFLLSTLGSHAEEQLSLHPLNGLVLQAVASMPRGGGYSTGRSATQALQNAVRISNEELQINTSQATPSCCSGATYIIFLKVLSTLEARKQLEISPSLKSALQPITQPDGKGIWGRWNANGPGTARLFYELGLGPNFTDLSKAVPGDFLKIFWNDNIGASEHGHSVIYLGRESKAGIESIRFWSSNIPGGYGEKSVSLNRIHRMLFSRLEHPAAIANPLPRTDSYLASLEHRSSTVSEMNQACGLQR